jgi:hypothetical protein
MSGNDPVFRPVELLRKIYPGLADDQKAKVKEAVEMVKEIQADLEQLRDANLGLHEALSAALPEAPASATVKVVEKSTQLEWLVTARVAPAALALIDDLPGIGARLLERGFIAVDIYIDQRKAERQATATPSANGAGASNGSAPVCKYHGEMSRSKKFAGWYCRSKMGDDSWCKEQVKD